MGEAAKKAGVAIELEGLGVATRPDALIAGVPTRPHSKPIGFVYFDVPRLGQCSELLRPDFYSVELLKAPYWEEVRARLTSSDGRKVIVTDVEVQPIPPGATVPQNVAIEIGEDHGTV